MILFRRLGIEVKKNLSKLISSKDRIEISDILNSDFHEIQTLKLSPLRKLSYIFYSNYKAAPIYQEFNKKLQQHLLTLFPTLQQPYKSLIIKNLSFGIDKNIEFNPQLLECMINTLKLAKGFSFHENELYPLIKFFPVFNKYKIDYESQIQNFFSQMKIESFHTMSHQDLVVLCIILTRIGSINKYFELLIENQESIYSILETLISQQVTSFSINDLFGVLKCFVVNDRGSEDFIRTLEHKIFTNLNLLLSRELADISNIYNKRILYHNDYLLYNIYKPLYEELIVRFDKIDPMTLSLFLFNSWRNSNFHGMYCDDRLKMKIKNTLANEEYFINIDNKTRSFLLQNMISVLSHCRKLDDECVESLLNLEKRFTQDLDEIFYMRITNYLSRYGKIDDSILEKFSSHFGKLYENPENYPLLYYIWINIKLKIPEKMSQVTSSFTPERVAKLQEEWKKSRYEYFHQSGSSQIHNEFKELLSKLKIDFISEHYDEYFMDLALPKYKICIEILGPGHYIFPEQQPNGKTLNKLEIFEKLGWKCHIYPFYMHKYRVLSIKPFLSRILPIDFTE